MQNKGQTAGELELDKLYSMVELEVKGHDPAVLKSYEDFTLMAAEHLGVRLKDKYDMTSDFINF